MALVVQIFFSFAFAFSYFEGTAFIAQGSVGGLFILSTSLIRYIFPFIKN